MNDIKKVRQVKDRIRFFQDTEVNPVIRGEKPDPPPFALSPNAITWDTWDKKTEPSPSQVDIMISEVTGRKIQGIVNHFNLKDWSVQKTWGPGQAVYHWKGTKSVHSAINSFLTKGSVSEYLRYGWPEYFSGRNTIGKMKEALQEDIKAGEETDETEKEDLRRKREEERLSMLEDWEKEQERKRKLEALNARKTRAKRKAEYKIFEKSVDKILNIQLSSNRSNNLLKFRERFYKWYKPLMQKLNKILLMEQYDPEGFDWQSGLHQDLMLYKDLYDIAMESHKEINVAEELAKKRKKETRKKFVKEEKEKEEVKTINELNKSGSSRVEKLLKEYDSLVDKKDTLTKLQYSFISGKIIEKIKRVRKNIEDTRRRVWNDSLRYLKDKYPEFWEIN